MVFCWNDQRDPREGGGASRLAGSPMVARPKMEQTWILTGADCSLPVPSLPVTLPQIHCAIRRQTI